VLTNHVDPEQLTRNDRKLAKKKNGDTKHRFIGMSYGM
jgi:hypothetical protein